MGFLNMPIVVADDLNVWKMTKTISLVVFGLVASAAASNPTIIQGNPKRFTYTQMKTPFSGPCDVSEGPDGLVYVQELFANKIARYNQHTGELTEYNIPFTSPLLPNISIPIPGGDEKAVILSCAIRNGYDGYMYFSNGNRDQLVRHDVHTGKTVVFTPPGSPLGNLQPLNDLTTAPDGVYFSQTTANVITKFDYKTHNFTNYNVPTIDGSPLGMYYASDGGVWFLEFIGNKVGRLDRETGTIQEYNIPLAGAGPIVVRAETVDPQGDYLLWFACVLGGAVASINERTGEITVYPESFFSNPVEVAQDYSNNVWISHFSMDTLGVLNTTTHKYFEIIMPKTIAPTPVSAPIYGGSGIFCKPIGDPTFGHGGIGDAVWFTQMTENRLVRFDISGLMF